MKVSQEQVNAWIAELTAGAAPLPDGETISEIADRTGMAHRKVSHMMKALLQEGYAERGRAPRQAVDGRQASIVVFKIKGSQ